MPWLSVICFFSGAFLGRLLGEGAKEPLQQAMSRDAGFFRYAVEHGLVTPRYEGGDKPATLEEAFGLMAYPIYAVWFGVPLCGILLVGILIWLAIRSLF